MKVKKRKSERVKQKSRNKKSDPKYKLITVNHLLEKKCQMTASIFWHLNFDDFFLFHISGKNLEIAVMSRGQPMRMMNLDEIEIYVKEIDEEKEKEAAQKKRERGTTESTA